MGTHGDPAKWGMPGWRIEQKFAPGVLIGNWSEDQHRFQRGCYKHNTTHRTDFVTYGKEFKPDVLVRRNGMIRSEGLGKDRIFSHHGDKYKCNYITWYDEHYNRRERCHDKFPEKRTWDFRRAGKWTPEKTDYPMQGQSTNWGLYETKKEEWENTEAEEKRAALGSTYQGDYYTTTNEDLVKTRYGVPREQSTTLHKANSINKNLSLRGKTVLHSPEKLPSLNNPAAPVLLTSK